MQKLFKNWIFTLITCILLSMLAVVMFLGALDLKGFTLANDILHLLVAVALVLYLIFAVFPLFVRYRGASLAFLAGEVALLVLVIVGQTCTQFVDVPLFADMPVCSVLGITLWLRGVVEMIHAFLVRRLEGVKQLPLWGFCLYMALASLGIWQVASPTVPDKYFLFVIGTVAAVVATIFGVFTAQNRRALPPRAKKQKPQEAPTAPVVPAIEEGEVPKAALPEGESVTVPQPSAPDEPKA